MEKTDFDNAVSQFAAAADLIAAGVSADERLRAHQMRAFFRLLQARALEGAERRTINDELFKSTASAALTMAGQKLYAPASALIEQARSLLLN
jgi:N12 class adenine-specific DNA methylase